MNSLIKRWHITREWPILTYVAEESSRWSEKDASNNIYYSQQSRGTPQSSLIVAMRYIFMSHFVLLTTT
jgi:hypothetical protein